MIPYPNQDHEYEFKWLSPLPHPIPRILKSLSSLQARVLSQEVLKIKDLYFDTPHQTLLASKAKCRIRAINKKWEITVKGASQSLQGMTARKEITFRVQKQPSLALRARRGILKKLFKDIPLVPLFMISNTRKLYHISLLGKAHAELCLDNFKIHHDKQSKQYGEVELEFLSGSLPVFMTFARKFKKKAGLKTARISKFSRAAKRFKIQSPKI